MPLILRRRHADYYAAAAAARLLAATLPFALRQRCAADIDIA